MQICIIVDPKSGYYITAQIRTANDINPLRREFIKFIHEQLGYYCNPTVRIKQVPLH